MRSHLRVVYAELADEHRQLTALLERFENHSTLFGLLPMLEELHRLLIDHFAHEQFPGGLYESLGAYQSVYGSDVKGVIREHCVLLSRVSSLLERVRMATGDQEEQPLSDVYDIVSRLYQHEVKEHRLANRLLEKA